MYIRYIILLVWCVLSCNSAKAPDVDFLVGTWQVEGKEQFEVWNKEKDGIYSGYAYSMVNGEKYFSEMLQIRTSGDQIVFEANVEGQNDGASIPFKLNPNVKDKLSFENLSHDFPKRIQYERIDEQTLSVSVLGDGEKGMTYKQVRVKSE